MTKDAGTSSVPKVYAAIAAVTHEMSKEGISKDRKNESQGYAFRGIDDVYGALSPLLSKHKLCVLPRVTQREVVERQNARGNALFYTTLTVEFDFVSAEDGSRHTVVTVGEAMDSGDKSCNKAMSAAYKYACFQAFCIPTEGDNDADATTHVVAPKAAPAPAPAPKAAAPAPKPLPERVTKAPAPGPTITAAQVDDLKAFSDTANVPLASICKKYSIATIDLLPAGEFDGVVARLNEIIASHEQAATTN